MILIKDDYNKLRVKTKINLKTRVQKLKLKNIDFPEKS